MRLQKLANWLSEGELEQYKQQAEQTKHEQYKLQKLESQLEKLKTEVKQSQKEVSQAQAQLQINQGFQIELGETQLKLQKAETEAQLYKRQLFEQQKQFNQTQLEFEQIKQALSLSQNWIEPLTKPVQIVDIVRTLAKQDFETLWGFGIISPQSKSASSGGAIAVNGWVLGKKSLAQTVRVSCGENTILETPVNRSRPGVMQRYPDISTADKCGFEFCISVAGIPKITTFNLEGILEDKTIIPLCDFILESSQIELNDT